MSIFNPDQFLQTQHTGKLDTKIPPVPVGEYNAQIASVKIRVNKSKETGEEYVGLNIMWEVLDEGVKAMTKMEHPQVRQEFLLDLTADRNALDMGPYKNTRLGRVREAVGMNQPDRPFAISQLTGAMAKIKVGSRPNPQDPESPFAEVTNVAKL